MKTLTQHARRTPGARNWMRSGAKFSPTSSDGGIGILGIPVRAWRITGRRTLDTGNDVTMTATSFGRDAADAVDRYLRVIQPSGLAQNPGSIEFTREELTATEAL